MRTRVVLLALVLLTNAAFVAHAEHIDACGYLFKDDGCLFFHSFRSSLRYLLETYGGFEVGGLVHITGETDLRYPGCVIPDLPEVIVTNNSIEACEPVDLGCHVLWVPPAWDDESCPYFSYPGCGFGQVGIDPSGFASGDTIRVFGILDCTVASVCGVSGRVLLERVTACSDTLTSVSPMSWGRLKGLYR